jgi:hypothetical protein
MPYQSSQLEKYNLFTKYFQLLHLTLQLCQIAWSSFMIYEALVMSSISLKRIIPPLSIIIVAYVLTPKVFATDLLGVGISVKAIL